MQNEEIKKLFMQTYDSRPFESRVSEVKKHVLSKLNTCSEEIKGIAQRVRSKKIAEMLHEEITEEEKRTKRIEIYEKYENMIKEVENDGKKLVNQYFNKVKHLDCIGYYINFIQNFLQDDNDTIRYLKKNTIKNLAKKEIAFEDLAALMYLQIKIFGIIFDINNRINEYQDKGYKSMAIIGKDMGECESIKRNIEKIRKDVKLIRGKDSEYNAGISIVPSYLAKGLEFDCVFVYNVSKEKYKNTSLDIKLLYVILTRAMSKLHIYYIDEKTELI